MSEKVGGTKGQNDEGQKTKERQRTLLGATRVFATTCVPSPAARAFDAVWILVVCIIIVVFSLRSGTIWEATNKLVWTGLMATYPGWTRLRGPFRKQPRRTSGHADPAYAPFLPSHHIPVTRFYTHTRNAEKHPSARLPRDEFPSHVQPTTAGCFAPASGPTAAPTAAPTAPTNPRDRHSRSPEETEYPRYEVRGVRGEFQRPQGNPAGRRPRHRG